MKTSLILKSAILLFCVLHAFESQAKTENNILPDNHVFPSQFHRDFPTAENPKWNTHGNIYNVTFTINGLTSRAVYSSAGIFSYSITNYLPDRLPSNILKDIHKAYKNYKIHSATELNAHGNNAFHVILENENSYLTVKITKDDLEEIKTLWKSPGEEITALASHPD